VSRAFKYSILIGLLASLVVLMMAQLGTFDALDFALSTRLGIGMTTLAMPVEATRLLVLLLAFGTAWVTTEVTRWSLRILLAGVLLLELVFSSWLLAYFDTYFSPFAPLGAVLLAFLGASIYALSNVGQRKKKALDLLGSRMTPSAIHEVVEGEMPLPFEPRLVEASVLVVEVVNHEDLVDRASTDSYISLLNRVLETASEFLISEGAYLDQCDGEGVRAVFGIPVDDADHAARACVAALELARRLDNLNLELERDHHLSADFRIATNSDELIVATYGAGALTRLSVGGEPVDFSRAMCQANCQYGTRILIGGRTLELAAKVAEVRPVDLLSARDSGLPVEIYELLGTKATITAVELARRDLFWDGIVFFREGLLEEASEAFDRARPVGRKDPLIEFYRERIEREERKTRTTGGGSGSWHG